MSVIAVARKNNRIAIGADTLTGQGSIKIPGKYIANKTKIISFGDAYIGLAGSLTDQLVMESLRLRHPDLLRFDNVTNIFESIRSIQEILRTEYYTLPNEDDDHQPYESNQLNALIASPHGIFEIQSYREVLAFERFWAIGSGIRFALGAMHVVYDQYDDPVDIIKAGLEAACEFDKSCDRPIEIHTLDLR